MEIRYKPSFLREFKKLPPQVQTDAKEKIEEFRNTKNHQKLRVHKLHGRLKGFYSFSVTYQHRIVFSHETKNIVVFIAIGTHDVYQ